MRTRACCRLAQSHSLGLAQPNHLKPTGDYCYVIADTFGIDLESLQAINPQLNCELIQPSEQSLIAV